MVNFCGLAPRSPTGFGKSNLQSNVPSVLYKRTKEANSSKTMIFFNGLPEYCTFITPLPCLVGSSKFVSRIKIMSCASGSTSSDPCSPVAIKPAWTTYAVNSSQSICPSPSTSIKLNNSRTKDTIFNSSSFGGGTTE